MEASAVLWSDDSLKHSFRLPNRFHRHCSCGRNFLNHDSSETRDSTNRGKIYCVATDSAGMDADCLPRHRNRDLGLVLRMVCVLPRYWIVVLLFRCDVYHRWVWRLGVASSMADFGSGGGSDGNPHVWLVCKYILRDKPENLQLVCELETSTNSLGQLGAPGMPLMLNLNKTRNLVLLP